MAIVIGIDLGTTTITALAVERASGSVLAKRTATNRSLLHFDASTNGKSEWSASSMVGQALRTIREVSEALGTRAAEVAAIGITGQQHGILVVDDNLEEATCFLGWQDRRAAGPILEKARHLAGETISRTGCRLSAGYGAISLFALREKGELPAGTVCTIMDYFAAAITGEAPVTEASCAASLGCYDIVSGEWDDRIVSALGLPRSMFPRVVPAGTVVGPLTGRAANEIELPAGVPVHVGIGDNQASFLGSVADPSTTVLVNVGTGGQVSAWSSTFQFTDQVEARPFPGGGYLLVCAGLSGGAAFAALETLFPGTTLAELVGYAADVPPGCDGLVCEPFFLGTRHDPSCRGSFTGVSAANLSPGHFARAVMEGMARAFAGSYDRLKGLRGSAAHLAGAGNGLRANPLLARLVSEAFRMPLRLSPHPKEAAFGAALSTRLQG